MIGDKKEFNGIKVKEVTDNDHVGCPQCVFYDADKRPRCTIDDEGDDSCVDTLSHYERLEDDKYIRSRAYRGSSRVCHVCITIS